MKRAVLLVLVLMSGSLAGCLAGDEDSGVQVQLTDEQIDAILDDYFQDFVNNTTVTINDQTNSLHLKRLPDGSEVHKSVFVIDYHSRETCWHGNEIDYMNNTFVATQSVYNYSTDNTTSLVHPFVRSYYLVGLATTPKPC